MSTMSKLMRAQAMQRAAAQGGGLIDARAAAAAHKAAARLHPADALAAGSAMIANAKNRMDPRTFARMARRSMADESLFIDSTLQFEGGDFNEGYAGRYSGEDDPLHYGPVQMPLLSVPDDQAAQTILRVALTGGQRARLADGKIVRVGAIVQAGSANGGQLIAKTSTVRCTLEINEVSVRPIKVPLSYFVNSAIGTPLGYAITQSVLFSDEVAMAFEFTETLGGTSGETSNISITLDTEAR
jgi:hypothetical protein